MKLEVSMLTFVREIRGRATVTTSPFENTTTCQQIMSVERLHERWVKLGLATVPLNSSAEDEGGAAVENGGHEVRDALCISSWGCPGSCLQSNDLLPPNRGPVVHDKHTFQNKQLPRLTLTTSDRPSRAVARGVAGGRQGGPGAHRDPLERQRLPAQRQGGGDGQARGRAVEEVRPARRKWIGLSWAVHSAQPVFCCF